MNHLSNPIQPNPTITSASSLMLSIKTNFPEPCIRDDLDAELDSYHGRNEGSKTRKNSQLSSSRDRHNSQPHSAETKKITNEFKTQPQEEKEQEPSKKKDHESEIISEILKVRDKFSWVPKVPERNPVSTEDAFARIGEIRLKCMKPPSPPQEAEQHRVAM